MTDIAVLMLIMFLAVLALAVAGFLTAKRLPRNVAVLLAGVVTACMLLFGRYLADSVWVATIVPARMLPVWGNWLPLMAGLLAGIGWVLSSRPNAMKVAVLGMLVLLSMIVPYRPLFAERPTANVETWYRGVLQQTTNATCAPAAAVTALDRVYVETTEAEMVNLSFTTWRGTSLHGLMRGLAVKLAGAQWRPVAAQLTRDDLENLQGPAILFVGLPVDAPPDPRFVRWGWQPGVAHTVVFLGIRPDGRLDIGDPATGREGWSEEALSVLWKGIAIVLEPR